jgi:hypothetical protein
MNKPEAQAKLAAFQAIMSFDLRTQLHGLTLYSVGSVPEDGVLLVYADFDPDRLVTLAKAAKDAQHTAHKQNTIYSWVDDKKGKKGTKRTYAAIAGNRVVFGQSEQRVAQALDVITGTAGNLASGNLLPQLGVPGSTSFLQAVARKMDFLPSDPNAQVLRLSKAIRVEAGEAQQQLSLSVTLEANDEEVANNISSILNGLVSLMRLQKEKPESIKVAEALALKQDGATVKATLVLPAADVLQMIQADAARKARKREAKQE